MASDEETGKREKVYSATGERESKEKHSQSKEKRETKLVEGKRPSA